MGATALCPSAGDAGMGTGPLFPSARGIGMGTTAPFPSAKGSRAWHSPSLAPAGPLSASPPPLFADARVGTPAQITSADPRDDNVICQWSVVRRQLLPEVRTQLTTDNRPPTKSPPCPTSFPAATQSFSPGAATSAQESPPT